MLINPQGLPIARSDEELTLETSAFDSLYGGQFTSSTELKKPNCLLLGNLGEGLPPYNYESMFYPSTVITLSLWISISKT